MSTGRNTCRNAQVSEFTSSLFEKKWLNSFLIDFVRCSELLANINSGSIFSLLPLNVLMLAFTLYNIEHVSLSCDSFNTIFFRPSLKIFPNFKTSSNVPMLIFHGLCAIRERTTWPFLYCYNANSIIDRMSSIASSLFESNWYDYPLEQQKYIILMIARSQKSTEFSGFGLIKCKLEVLGYVRILLTRMCHPSSIFTINLLYCSFTKHPAPTTSFSESCNIF